VFLWDKLITNNSSTNQPKIKQFIREIRNDLYLYHHHAESTLGLNCGQQRSPLLASALLNLIITDGETNVKLQIVHNRGLYHVKN